MPGVIGITNNQEDISSCDFNSNLEKPYKLSLIVSEVNNCIRPDPTLKEVECQGTLVPYNGGCSSMVERTVVVRKTSVQFTPSALWVFLLEKEKLQCKRKLLLQKETTMVEKTNKGGWVNN